MIKYAERVRETFTTTGTGTLNLLGAVTGFQTVVAGIATGEEGYFLATDGTNWEVFRGTVTDAAPDTLTRSVIKSSNADALVSWAAGTKDIFLITPADVVDKVRGPNLIQNGDFRVVQQGTSFTSATTPANSDDNYLFDRWILLSDGNDIVDVTQGTDGAVGNETYLQADVETTAKKFGFLQIIENKDIYELLDESGVVTVSFNASVSDAAKLSRIKVMILSWTSTADAVTSDVVNAWGIEGTSPTVVANWTIEGDSGDLNVTTSDVRYTLANVAINASGVTNIAMLIWSDDVATNDTLGTLLRITDVQIEAGPVATKFQRRNISEELLLCQRHYQKTFPQGTAPAQNAANEGVWSRQQGAAASTAVSLGTVEFMVTMRAAPTITLYNPDASNAQIRNTTAGSDWSSSSTSLESDRGFEISGTTPGGSSEAQAATVHWTADAKL